MGIMVAYGSYVKKETNLMKSINQIEIFDTIVALLAGLMIVPAVFTFMGTEGMSAGPGLMFVSLPKVFQSMGAAGGVIGTIFFLMVSFAAITSSVSVMESIVSCMIDKFHISRKKLSLIHISIVILISHRLYLFDQMDQVIWMDEGHTKVGTHEELLAEVPSYAELCRDQTKGGSNDEK